MSLSRIILEGLVNNTLTNLEITHRLTSEDVKILISLIPKCTQLKSISLPIASPRADNAQEKALFEVLDRGSIIVTKIDDMKVEHSEDSPSDVAKVYNDLGNVYYWHGDYPESIASYTEAIRLDSKNAQYHNNLGDAYSQHGNYKDAEVAHKKAIEFAPDNARYHNNLGYAHYQQGNYKDAEVSYKKAIEFAPGEVVYHNNLGNSYVRQSNYKDAEVSYKKAIELVPQNAQYHNDLGNAYFKQAKYKDAEVSYKKATEFAPQNAQYHSNLGDTYVRQSNYPDAEAAYKKAIELVPQNAQYHNDLGSFYYNQAKYKDAEVAYKKATEFAPDNAVYHNYLGNAYFTQAKHKDAEVSYKKAIELVPDQVVYYDNLGNAYFRQRNYPDAEVAYKKATEFAPDNAQYHNDLGNAYFKQAKYKDAEVAHKKATEFAPQNAMYHHDLGNAYFKQAKYKDAEVSYKKAIEFAPNNAHYHNNLGEAYSQHGNYKDAEVAHKKAIEFAPDNARYHNNLGYAHYQQGNYKDAEVSYKKAIEFAPGEVVYHNNLGNAYFKQAKYKDSEVAYKKAIEFAPDNAAYHNDLGNAYFKQAKYKDAEVSYKKAIEFAPGDVVYHNNLGNAYLRQSNYLDAEVSYKKATEFAPDNAAYHNYLGNSYFQQAKHKDAEVSYKKAIESAPTNAEYQKNLQVNNAALQQQIKTQSMNTGTAQAPTKSSVAELKAAAKQKMLEKIRATNTQTASKASDKDAKKSVPSKASKASEASTLKKPEQQQTISKQDTKPVAEAASAPVIKPVKKASEYYKIAIGKKDSGQHIEAINALTEAIRLDSKTPSYHNELGNIYYAMDDFTKAREEYLCAIAIDPGKAHYHDNLGSANYALGQYQEAQDEYKKAIFINNNNPDYHCNYGDALLKDTTISENVILAYIEYRKACSISPEGEVYKVQAEAAKAKIYDLRIRHLDLKNKDISDADLIYLVEILQNIRHYTSLDLQGNSRITTSSYSDLSDAIKGTLISNVLLDNESDIIDQICKDNHAARMSQIMVLFSEESLSTIYVDILTDEFYNQLLDTPDLVDALKDNMFLAHLLLNIVMLQSDNIQDIDLSGIKDRLIAKKLKYNFKRDSDDASDEDLACQGQAFVDADIVTKHLYGFDIMQNLANISDPRAIVQLVKLVYSSKASFDTMGCDGALSLCYKLLTIAPEFPQDSCYLDLFEKLSHSLTLEEKGALSRACIDFHMYNLAIIASHGAEDSAECYMNMGHAYALEERYDQSTAAWNSAIELLKQEIEVDAAAVTRDKTQGATKSLIKKGDSSPTSTTPPLQQIVKKVSFNNLCEQRLFEKDDSEEDAQDSAKCSEKAQEVTMLPCVEEEDVWASTRVPVKVTCISNSAKLAECYFHLGHSEHKSDNIASAKNHFKLAYDIQPDNQDYKSSYELLPSKGRKGAKKTSITTQSSSSSDDDEVQFISPVHHTKKATSSDQDATILNLSAKWTINKHDYTSGNTIVRVEGLTKCYAAIESHCLERVGEVTVKMFKSAVQKAAFSKVGSNGIKLLSDAKGYEVKINDDDRLFCNIVYKNEQNDILMIFNKYAATHVALDNFAKDGNVILNVYDTPEQIDLVTIIGCAV